MYPYTITTALPCPALLHNNYYYTTVTASLRQMK